MLSQTVFPPDIRLEKEIRSLSKLGNEIVVICNQYQKNLNPDFEFCKIERVRALFKKIKFNKIINFPLFINPRYLFLAIKLMFKFKPHVVHAHDLVMVPLALILKLIDKKIKVIYDMHENYPEALKYFQKEGFQKIIKNYKIAAFIDQFCIKYSDRIIVVIDENRNRLMELGVSPEKVFVVSNVADLNYFNDSSVSNTENPDYEDKFLLLYTGTVSPERGLETPVKAMTLLKEKIKNVYLLIIGDGNSVVTLKKMVGSLSLEKYVELKSWVGHHNLKRYFQAADICIIPQPYNDYINTTIPHKLFEYMAQSKPVIVSDAKPLKRIIEETGAGLVFTSNDERNFAEQVLKIYIDNGNYGGNGKNAVENKYNWEIEEKKLIKVYNSLN